MLGVGHFEAGVWLECESHILSTTHSRPKHWKHNIFATFSVCLTNIFHLRVCIENVPTRYEQMNAACFEQTGQ